MMHPRDVGHHLAISGIAALTTWVALTAWRPFLTTPGDYLGPVAVMALVLAGLGATLRSFRVSAGLTLAAQLVAATSMLCRQLSGSFVPSRDNLAVALEAISTAQESAREYAAPIGTDVPSIAPLLIVGGLLLILAVDLIVCGLQRVPIAGLVLLGIYSIPAGVPGSGSAWFSFLVAAAGFLILLHLEAGHRLQRWGRAVGPHTGNPDLEVSLFSDALRTGAGRIGVTAIALAFATPLVVPLMDLDVIGIGGGGGGAGDIRIRKPITDMRRDLQRPEDLAVINVVTDDPAPGYLRVAVLNRYTGAEWSSGDRDVSSTNRATGRLPEPLGVVASVPRRTWEYDVRVHDRFDSTWLPTQFPAAAVTAAGDWRFDPASMDFLAADGQTTAGLRYEVTAIDYDYGTDGSLFRDAAPGAVDEQFLELPDQIPESVVTRAREVTAAARTDYERATLLQRWFRSEFDYSLERAPEGTGNQTLEGFLAPGGRVGYCEQFASAMAVMARALGIPARVAVGFLRPDQEMDGTWTYSTHDLHAWPELYFSRVGWVRFEPTPAGRAARVPSYTRVPSRIDRPDQGPDGSPQQDPTADTQQPDPAAVPPIDPDAGAEAAEGAGDAGISATRLALLGAVGVLLIGIGAFAPQLLRSRQRRRRLAGTADDLWEELRASLIDLDLPWPHGQSPRQVAAALSKYVDSAPTDAALARIVREVEEERYARPGSRSGVDVSLVADAEHCLAAFTAAATPRARRRARWLPRSLWPSFVDETELAQAESFRQ